MLLSVFSPGNLNKKPWLQVHLEYCEEKKRRKYIQENPFGPALKMKKNKKSSILYVSKK